MTVPKNVFESLAPGQGGVVRYQGLMDNLFSKRLNNFSLDVFW